MLTFAKLKPQNVRAPTLQVMLQGLLVAFAFLLSLGAHAQSSACVANETAQILRYQQEVGRQVRWGHCLSQLVQASMQSR